MNQVLERGADSSYAREQELLREPWTPGVIANDEETPQHWRSKSHYCRVSAGDEGEPGSGLTPLVSEPQVFEQAPVPAKGPEHPVLTSGDLNRDRQDPGREVTPHLLPSITPWWVLSDDAPPPPGKGATVPPRQGPPAQHGSAETRPGSRGHAGGLTYSQTHG